MGMIPLATLKINMQLPYLSILDLEIQGQIGTHGMLTVKVMAEESSTQSDVLRLQDTLISVTGEKGAFIFSGICTGASLSEQAGYKEITLTARSMSYLSDQVKQNVTFQNPNKTLLGMLTSVFAKYNATLKIDKDVTIETIVSQKEETDWQFLNRMAGQYGKTVLTDSRASEMVIHIGNVPFQTSKASYEVKSSQIDMNAARQNRANGENARETFEYEKITGLTYDLGASLGDIINGQTIVKSEMKVRGGIVTNQIEMQHGESIQPNAVDNLKKQSESQVLTGTVETIDGNRMQVKLHTDGKDAGESIWVTYESAISNSFYCMPDEKDQVFIYYDNKGTAVCLGSRRSSADEADFEKTKDKSMTSEDNMLRIAEGAVELTTTKKQYEQDMQNSICIVLDDTEGITIQSTEEISLEADARLTMSAITSPEGEASFDSAKAAFLSRDEAGKKKYEADGGLTLMEFFKKDSAASWDKFKSDVKADVDKALYVEEREKIKQWIKDTFSSKSDSPENAQEGEEESYETGMLVLFSESNRLFMMVGESSLYCGEGFLHFVSPDFRWSGAKAGTHPIDSVENRNWLDNVLDVVQFGLDVLGMIPGVGIVPDLLNAGISASRGNYGEAAMSLIAAIPVIGEAGGLGKIGYKISKFSKFCKECKWIKRAKWIKTGITAALDTVRNWDSIVICFKAHIKFLTGGLLFHDVELKFTDVMNFLKTGKSYASFGLSTADVFGGNSKNKGKGSKTEEGDANKTKTTDKKNDKKKQNSGDKEENSKKKENGGKAKEKKHDGDPVDMVTGSLYLKQTEIILEDVLEQFELERTYESVYENPGKMLGSRWILNIESNMSFEEDMVTVRMPDNHLEQFRKYGEEFVSLRKGDKSLLLKKENIGYSLYVYSEKSQYYFDEEGQCLEIIDANGNKTSYKYENNRLAELCLASGQRLKFTYTGQLLSKIEDKIGRQLHYKYEEDYLTEVTYPNGQTIKYTYDKEGHITSIQDQRGITYVQNTYDRKGRMLKQQMCNGEEYLYLYDDANRVNTIITASNGRQVRYAYNYNNLVTKISFSDGSEEEVRYDESQNIIYHRDRNGNETYSAYDPYGNLLEETDPSGLHTTYSYDECGNLLGWKDNAGREVTYLYDDRGNPVCMSEKIEEGFYVKETYTYDGKGRMLTHTDANGNTITRSYQTSFSSATRYVGAEGETYSYEYDEAGRLMAVITESGRRSFGYNTMDYQTHYVDELGNTTRFHYDASNNLIKEILPEQFEPETENGAGTSYIYDEMDDLIEVTDATGRTETYKRNLQGQLLEEDGIRYDYDKDGNQTHIYYPNGGVERIFYDYNGNIIKKIQPLEYDQKLDDGMGYLYEYDSCDRLIEVTAPNGEIENRYVYDLAGNITKIIDAQGYKSGNTDEERIGTLYRYNAAGWLLEERKPVRRENDEIYYRLIAYTYDKSGNILSEKRYLDEQTEESADGKVNIIHKIYDKSNRLIQVTDEEGAQIDYRYNTRNYLTYEKRKINDNAHMQTAYRYNAAGYLESVIKSADKSYQGKSSVSYRYAHDKNGNIIQMETPLQTRIQRSYDPAGRILEEMHIENGDGIHNRICYAYDEKGNLSQVTDLKGNAVRYAYDSLNRVIEIQNEEGAVSRQEYDLNGRIVKELSPNEVVKLSTYESEGRRYTYDILGRITKITAPDGTIEEQVAYDSRGFVISRLDAAGNGTFEQYDLGGRRKEVCTVGGSRQQYFYDAAGNLTGIRDGNENLTQFHVDGWGRVQEVLLPDGSKESYAYDYAGNMIQATDGEGNSTTFTYNEVNLLAERTDAAGAKEIYRYDEEERLASMTNRNGEHIRFCYNAYGDLTLKENKQTGEQEVFGYTKEGLLKYAIAGGMRYDYTYDACGRLKEKKASGKCLLSNSYDLNGNRIRQRDVTGKETNYVYDINDRLIQISDGKHVLAGYTYHPSGMVESLSIGKDILTSYDYDADYNLSSLKIRMGNGGKDGIYSASSGIGQAIPVSNPLEQKPVRQSNLSFLAQNKYEYDKNGNCIGKETLTGQIKYAYDERNRLIQAAYPAYQERYAYDRAGNRIGRESTRNGGIKETYTYGAANRLESMSVHHMGEIRKIDYTYDKQGSLVKETDSKRGTTVYSYDGFNRLKEVHTPEQGILKNRYDGEGMRYELEENGRLIQFVYNADREVITEEAKEDTKRYFRGYTLISSDSEKAKTYYHYASDELGSITHVLGRKEESDSLEVLNRYIYDAFGNVIECEESVENRFRFAGEQYDQITGQYYLRARFYNPVIGRFTQEDTYYGDGLNLYTYCDNNPVRYVDPSGYGKQDSNQKQRKRKESDWDRFRKENKGKYTREEMSAAYQKYKADQAAKQNNKPKAKKPSNKSTSNKKSGQVGSYTIVFENGKKYHGKGPKSRMEQSAKEKSKKYKTKVKSKDWTPAANDEDAFIDEYLRMEKDGGYNSNNNYNIRQSPGKKYYEEREKKRKRKK